MYLNSGHLQDSIIQLLMGFRRHLLSIFCMPSTISELSLGSALKKDMAPVVIESLDDPDQKKKKK